MTFGAETDTASASATRPVHRRGRHAGRHGRRVRRRQIGEIIGRWFAGRTAEVTEPVVLATKGRAGG